MFGFLAKALSRNDDPLPRPPRRRIHGVMWIWRGFYQLSEEGFVLGDIPGDEFADLGYAMGCVKDDDGDLIIVTDARAVGVMKEEIARVVADDDKEDFPCLDS